MLNRLSLDDLVELRNKIVFIYLDKNLKPFEFKGLKFYPEANGIIIKDSLNRERVILAPITLKKLDLCISYIKIEEFLKNNEPNCTEVGFDADLYPKLDCYIRGKYNTVSYVPLNLTDSEEEITFQLLNGLATLKSKMNGNLN